MRKLILAIPVLLTMMSLSGCLWAPDLDRVREEIERQLPGAHFEREFAISLGPVSLGFARVVTAMVPPAHEARDYLKEIHRVKVAVYRTENLPELDELQMPTRLAALAERDEWDVAIKVREGGEEAVWVLYRSDDGEVRELYLVVLNNEELVMVRAAGNIDELAVKAMRDHRRGRDFAVDEFF